MKPIVCPVCKKGTLFQSQNSFTCNHFDENSKICNFSILKNYFSKELTIDDILQLVSTGETNVFNDLKNQKGDFFSAKLGIVNGYISPIFENNTLKDTKCANCEGDIFITKKGYACENFFNNSCQMFVYRTYNDVNIDEKTASILINGGTTAFFHNLKNHKGDFFSAKLFIDENTFKVAFDYSLGNCPKCNDGIIKKRNAVYGCSNYFTDVKCDFGIFHTIFSYEVSFDDVELLINGNKTDIKSFDWNNKKSSGSLYLDENFKCKIEYNAS